MYSVNHLTEKTRLCSRKNKTKENEPNVIDLEGIRHGMSPVAGWVGGKKKRWGRRQWMCVRGVGPVNHPLQVASLSLSLVTHIPLRVGAKAHCLGGCLNFHQLRCLEGAPRVLRDQRNTKGITTV